MITDAAHDGREGIVLDQGTPSRLVIAWFGVIEPALDILPGGTGVVARRHPVDVDRSFDPPGPGPIGMAGPNLERDGERKFLHTFSSIASLSLRGASASPYMEML